MQLITKFAPSPNLFNISISLSAVINILAIAVCSFNFGRFILNFKIGNKLEKTFYNNFGLHKKFSR